eukprot:CAMPEP_0202692190 /NCGR_PEP_ID=MMETSP1385-20130828/6630_1 /ASSEMBLY_ACC=CAM_ASM_000861 /TAXON_ID=933848 /ORGANISM="Elphidium margaritaceum" /LENGTH=690 /DNA_ID=CAMNT_0049347679 /DNA_START=34 /DNA_END=2106 /DNA_ORIENTATION=-
MTTSSRITADVLTLIRLKHGSLNVIAAQNEIKIKIGNAMNQLNDTDSRSVGLSILRSIIDHLPSKLMHLVIEPFYSINHEFKPLCRREIALLLGYIGWKRGNTAIFYKYLSKIVHNLSKRASDSDSRVREACGDSFSRITKQSLQYADKTGGIEYSEQRTLSTAQEVLEKILKPILKSIEKSMSSNAINGNFVCLSNVILAADTYLTLQLVSVICQCVISNILNVRDAKTHTSLLCCIEKLFTVAAPILASTTASSHNKRSGHEKHTDYLSALLVIIIDGLSNKDWSVRNHALKALHSVGIIFSDVERKPEIEHYRNEIVAHLQRLKYDKISNVRNSAIMTLAIWSEIIEKADDDDDDDDDQVDADKAIDAEQHITADIDELDGWRMQQLVVDKPWYDEQSERTVNAEQASASETALPPPQPSALTSTSTAAVIEAPQQSASDVQQCDNSNSNVLLLQQQQLILKNIKNLESYIHREIGGIKSRIHGVERDVQRMKVVQQNNEWIQQNQLPRARRRHVQKQYEPPRKIDRDRAVTELEARAEMKENEENDDEHVQAAAGTSTAVYESETISVYSDETRIVDLNEQLLSVIQLDNNTELVQWLIQNNAHFLFQYIDDRLMISLIYRITQLLKNNKYVNDICDFLKKEFVVGSQNIPKSFSLPKPLKTEFLNGLNQQESIKPFVSQIANFVR